MKCRWKVFAGLSSSRLKVQENGRFLLVHRRYSLGVNKRRMLRHNWLLGRHGISYMPAASTSGLARVIVN